MNYSCILRYLLIKHLSESRPWLANVVCFWVVWLGLKQKCNKRIYTKMIIAILFLQKLRDCRIWKIMQLSWSDPTDLHKCAFLSRPGLGWNKSTKIIPITRAEKFWMTSNNAGVLFRDFHATLLSKKTDIQTLQKCWTVKKFIFKWL